MYEVDRRLNQRLATNTENWMPGFVATAAVAAAVAAVAAVAAAKVNGAGGVAVIGAGALALGVGGIVKVVKSLY